MVGAENGPPTTTTKERPSTTTMWRPSASKTHSAVGGVDAGRPDVVGHRDRAVGGVDQEVAREHRGHHAPVGRVQLDAVGVRNPDADAGAVSPAP